MPRLYHAVDRNDPFYSRDPGFTKRPLMLDAIDWIDGWPTVRGGNWASDSPQPAPAAQPGDLQGSSAPVANDASGVAVVIDSVVK